ncbi:DoxX family protein [Cohnella sp.]|uniref:DoxX family protein n=1 Tax=Cohnella sp. TaxID=1883426 RepID=UPI00356B4F65
MMNKQVHVGLLLLRLALGLTFFIHGIMKFQGGITNTSGWFQSIGLPGFAVYVVAILELAGGVALVLGLGTRIIAALFSIVMLVAIVKVKLGVGFVGGSELEIALFSMSICLAFAGKTGYSLDSVLFRNKNMENSKFI